MAGEYYVHLRVDGGGQVPLGYVLAPAELPELLRHVADFYDDNPGECAKLLSPLTPSAVPRHVGFPFSSPGIAADNAVYYGDNGPWRG